MADFGVDFTPIGNLANVYRQAQQRAQYENAINSLPTGATLADLNKLPVAALAGAGEQGLTLARLAQAASQDQRDYALREKMSTPQYRADVQRATSQVEAEFKPKLVPITTPSGETMTVEEIPATTPGGRPSYRLPTVEGQPSAPTNPFAFGKQTEAQSKDSGYADRMFRAEGVLRDPKVEEAATSLGQNVLGKAPGFVSNYLTGADYQKFDQAKRDFVNAVLRRESGAAISQSEFDNANKQYFPQPGDTPERIAEKKRNRQDAIAGVAGGGGPSYKPPYSFGPSGELVPSGAPPRGQAAPKPAAPQLPPALAASAKQAPDGNYYIPDPNRPGKFLKVNP